MPVAVDVAVSAAAELMACGTVPAVQRARQHTARAHRIPAVQRGQRDHCRRTVHPDRHPIRIDAQRAAQDGHHLEIRLVDGGENAVTEAARRPGRRGGRSLRGPAERRPGQFEVAGREAGQDPVGRDDRIGLWAQPAVQVGRLDHGPAVCGHRGPDPDGGHALVTVVGAEQFLGQSPGRHEVTRGGQRVGQCRADVGAAR